jgi:hypothetical protein
VENVGFLKEEEHGSDFREDEFDHGIGIYIFIGSEKLL